MNHPILTSVFFLLIVSFFFSPAGFTQENAETVLTRVNSLSPHERNKILLAEARREKVVEWYGTLSVPRAQEVIGKFKSRYPFLEVKYTRAGGGSLANRVLTEFKGGVHNVDVIAARGNFHPALMEAGVVAKNLTPVRVELRDGFTDERGYFLGYSAYALVIAYNKREVAADQAPQSYTDLLAPQWKGQMALDMESYDWLAGMLDVYGEQKGMELAQKLAAQDLLIQRGHTLLTQLLISGGVKILIDGYHHQVVNFMEMDAPVDFSVPDPVIVKEPSALWIAKQARHPHAAALLVDFLLSQEGQQVLAEQHFLLARRDMNWNLGGKKIGKIHFLSTEKWGSRYNDLVKEFDRIFRKEKK